MPLTDLFISTYSLSIMGLPTDGKKAFGSIMIYTSILHTTNGQLKISIKSPTGTEVILSNNRGDSKSNIFSGTLFSDFSTNLISTYPSINGISIPHTKAESPLSILLDGNPNGNWQLKVTDSTLGGQGTLQSFYIVFLGFFFIFLFF
jgi:subtilisin-like proprotein convertase family protein